MNLPIITEHPVASTLVATEPSLNNLDAPSRPGPSTLSFPWSRETCFALLALVILWLAKVYSTWARWGDLSIDSGHEMYIPLLLAQGKELYRDVWFMYGPLAPYFNSYLFRFFGIHLEVLYWAGSISALGSAVFLYFTGKQLSSDVVGWTAGAVVLMEAFQPGLFCFPLPYSFAAVYACFTGCVFLWVAIHASTSIKRVWMFAAGSLAAVLLLLKPEFGMAAYATLLPLIFVRSYSRRSWRTGFQDVLLTLPGIAICGAVILWMVSIRGVEFITQENIVSWPTSFFMKNFGRMWMERTGFTVSATAFAEAMSRAVPIGGLALLAYGIFWWKRSDTFAVALKYALALVMLVYFAGKYNYALPFRMGMEAMLTAIFFPRDMVLYVVFATLIAWGYFFRPARTTVVRRPELPLLLTFSSLLAFRILMKMQPGQYSIYYNGPVVLSFLLLACMLIPKSGRSRRFILSGQVTICLACLFTATLYAKRIEDIAKYYVPLVTERGTIRTTQLRAENYKAALQFMKEKAAIGESVLSVPEDTSLYFLSDTYGPTRVFSFTPGVLAPGKMTDELTRQIDEKPVRYLLWSNRIFPEFGVPVFGKDFDVEVGDFLRSRYRRVGPLTPITGPCCDWTASVWERKADAELK